MYSQLPCWYAIYIMYSLYWFTQFSILTVFKTSTLCIIYIIYWLNLLINFVFYVLILFKTDTPCIIFTNINMYLLLSLIMFLGCMTCNFFFFIIWTNLLCKKHPWTGFLLWKACINKVYCYLLSLSFPRSCGGLAVVKHVLDGCDRERSLGVEVGRPIHVEACHWRAQSRRHRARLAIQVRHRSLMYRLSLL